MADSNKQLTGLKKRQQIASAKKLIFIWIIVAAVAISICGVAVQFLFRQAAFNQKVIGEKSKTQRTLDDNLDNASELKKKVDALLADTNLAKVKANPDDTNLKVVLDALPTSDDKSALASSLQQVILPQSGISLSELSTFGDGAVSSIDPLTGLAAETTLDSKTAQPTNFNFGATSGYEQMKNMLRDLERTIRPIQVQKLSFQGSDTTLQVTVEGMTYYLPERTVTLGKKTVKP